MANIFKLFVAKNLDDVTLEQAFITDFRETQDMI